MCRGNGRRSKMGWCRIWNFMRTSEHKQANRQTRSGSGVWSSGGPYKKRNCTTQRQTEDGEVDTSGCLRNESKQWKISNTPTTGSILSLPPPVAINFTKYESKSVHQHTGAGDDRRTAAVVGGRSGSAASNAETSRTRTSDGGDRKRTSVSRGLGYTRKPWGDFLSNKGGAVESVNSDSWRIAPRRLCLVRRCYRKLRQCENG